MTNIAAGGGFLALSSAVKAFLHRHDGKRILIENDRYEIVGYSDKRVDEIIAIIAAQRREEQERERIQAMPPTAVTFESSDGND